MNRYFLASSMIIGTFVIIAGLCAMYPDTATKYLPLLMLLIFFLFFSYFVVLYESKISSTKEIAVVAILGAFSAAARIPFAPIPSIQPSTFIIMVVGYVLGETAGFMVGAETAFLSNFLLGQGPWTPWQMLAWGLAGILSALFRRGFGGRKHELYMFIALGVAIGYLYGFIMNVWQWLTYTSPPTLAGLLLVESLSFPFDTLHAAGNAIFIQLFGPKFIDTLEKYKKRYGIFSDFEDAAR